MSSADSAFFTTRAASSLNPRALPMAPTSPDLKKFIEFLSPALIAGANALSGPPRATPVLASCLAKSTRSSGVCPRPAPDIAPSEPPAAAPVPIAKAVFPMSEVGALERRACPVLVEAAAPAPTANNGADAKPPPTCSAIVWPGRSSAIARCAARVACCASSENKPIASSANCPTNGTPWIAVAALAAMGLLSISSSLTPLRNDSAGVAPSMIRAIVSGLMVDIAGPTNPLLPSSRS